MKAEIDSIKFIIQGGNLTAELVAGKFIDIGLIDGIINDAGNIHKYELTFPTKYLALKLPPWIRPRIDYP